MTRKFYGIIWIPVILLFFGFIATAQNSQIDSLKKMYNNAIKSGLGDMLKRIDSLTMAVKTASDTNRVNTLNNLSNAYRWINSDTGIIISTQAYEEAKKLQYKTGMMRATRISMLIYMNRGDFNKYEEYARKSVPITQEVKNYRLLYDSYMRIGQCLHQKCKYTEAISYYQKGLDVVLETNQNQDAQIIVFNILIGNSFLKSGNFEKAYECFKKAFDYSSKLKDPNEITTAAGYAYEAMGDLYLKFEDLETAKYYYDKCPEMVYDDQENKTKYKVNLFMAMKNFDSALAYYRKYSQNRIAEWKLITPDSVLLNNFILGSTYMYGPINVGIKEFDKGIAYLKPALAFYSRNGQTEKELGTLEDLSKAYLGKSDFKTAGQYADELVSIARKVEAKSNLRNGYQLLSEIYEKAGNKDKANLYYRRYAELKDELKTDEFKQKLKLYKAEEEEKQKTGA
ncbi:MAG TPA: tetratricopeptide repeat protein, partial [Chitinophagaceae bacterium]|nr:tetratricopeptide repeat protein [Chitinophagaceae bacterium]